MHELRYLGFPVFCKKETPVPYVKINKISKAHYYLWYHKPEVQVQVESNVVTSVITFQNVLLKYWIFQNLKFFRVKLESLKKNQGLQNLTFFYG